MKLFKSLVLVCFFAVCTGPLFAQTKQLTLDDLFDPVKRVNFSGAFPRLSWLPDGKRLLDANFDPRRGPVGLFAVDAVTGARQPFHDAAAAERALVTAGIAADQAKRYSLLAGANFNPGYTAALLSVKNDLYLYDLGRMSATRLTSTPNDAEEEADFSPDGKQVSFVRGNNLYVVNADGTGERAITRDGGKTLLNGILDWVYEEEVYGRGKRRGYWWSPDSRLIAFLQIDESGVPEFIVNDDVPQGQTIERTNYPKAGDPNPRVKLLVVNLGNDRTRPVDLSAYKDPELIIARVGWTPDSQLLFEVQDRLQRMLDLVLSPSGRGDAATDDRPATRAARVLIHEESKAWVDNVELPEFLPDGSFIWQSDRSGNRHLYHYSGDGKLIRQITNGSWDVRDVNGVAGGFIYFTASEKSPIANHIYRVKTDGTGFERLSKAEGSHGANFNKECSAYLDSFSTVTTPPQLRLHRNDGTEIRTIEENKVAALAEYKFGTPEFVQVKTRDGFTMEAMMIKPPDFNPAKKYPVFSYTYSGPAAQQVVDRWGGTRYLWHQMLAQRGYIIWVCDNRSASNKGAATAHPIYRNLGELELRDLEDGVSYLKSLPYVDGNRIGLWGWSYGGYMTAYTLTHSTSFKIGIAGAPVTDWRNYDSIYTERYMGLPKDNAAGYDKSSPMKAAANLSGKLLLIHGLIDDNVHLQNSTQFIDALQKAGRQFEFMVYPQSRHGVVEPSRVKHMYTMMTNFIEKNL